LGDTEQLSRQIGHCPQCFEPLHRQGLSPERK
jgi:hypothetical protein